MSTAPIAPITPTFDVGRYSTLNSSQKEVAAGVNSRIDTYKGTNPELASDIYWKAAAEISKVSDDPGYREVEKVDAFKAINEALKDLDIRHNPDMFARRNLATSFTSATASIVGSDLQKLEGLDTAVFDSEITKSIASTAGGLPIDAADIDKVKASGRQLLAEKHITALGDIDKLSDTLFEDHLTKIADKSNELDKALRDAISKKREERIADVKERFEKKELSWQDVERIALGVTSDKLKNGLLEIVKADVDADKLKNASDTEASRLVGLEASEVADEIVGSSFFSNLAPEVQAVLSKDIEIQQKKNKRSEIRELREVEISERTLKEKKIELWKASSKVWLKRLSILGKGALLFGVAGALGGPGLTALFGKTALLGAFQSTGLLYGLLGAGTGIAVGGIEAAYDKNLGELKQGKVQISDELEDMNTIIDEIKNRYAKEEINDKVAFTKLYGTLFAKDSKMSVEEVQKAMLGKLKLSDLQEATTMVANAFK